MKRPKHVRLVAQVCKRWYVLVACMQLRKRGGLYRRIQCRKRSRVTYIRDCYNTEMRECAKIRNVRFKKVEGEWSLARSFLTFCQCHVHALEINDCSRFSSREYALIAAFCTGLNSVKLESCTTMQDSDLVEILHDCTHLRSVYLYQTPNLSLRNLEKGKDRRGFLEELGLYRGGIYASRLQELHVLGCSLVSGGTILALLKGFPKLKSLCLTGMRSPFCWEKANFRNERPPGRPLKLKSLELRNSDVITDEALQLLSGHFPKLKHLDLSNCASISDAGLSPLIAAYGGQLQKLTLTRCSKISDCSVRQLCGVAGQELQFLSLAGTNVTNDSLRILTDADARIGLKQLSLARCSNLTDEGLQHILALQNRRRPSPWKSLDLQNCEGISVLGLQELRSAMELMNSHLISVLDKSFVRDHQEISFD